MFHAVRCKNDRLCLSRLPVMDKEERRVQTQASLFDYAKRLLDKKKERLLVNFERAWKLFFRRGD